MNFGAFAAQKTIGRGGTAIVYEGRGPRGERVAIKVLSRDREAEPGRFERERRLLGSFGEEDGFVPLLGHGDSPQGPYLVMPFLAGGTLRDRLKMTPRMPASAVA